MAYTLENALDYAKSMEIVAAYYRDRPGRNFLSLGNLALIPLLRDLAWEHCGTLAGEKTWSLRADSHSYSFTTSENFMGSFESLKVYWDSGLTDCKPVVVVGMGAEGELVAEERGSEDYPEAVVDGQTIRLYPSPGQTEGMLEAHYKKRAATFTAMADSIQVSDDAFLALVYMLGSFLVDKPEIAGSLAALGKAEALNLGDTVRRKLVIKD